MQGTERLHRALLDIMVARRELDVREEIGTELSTLEEQLRLLLMTIELGEGVGGPDGQDDNPRFDVDDGGSNDDIGAVGPEHDRLGDGEGGA